MSVIVHGAGAPKIKPIEETFTVGFYYISEESEKSLYKQIQLPPREYHHIHLVGSLHSENEYQISFAEIDLVSNEWKYMYSFDTKAKYFSAQSGIGNTIMVGVYNNENGSSSYIYLSFEIVGDILNIYRSTSRRGGSISTSGEHSTEIKLTIY